ncbi:MAG: outer membrane lipoprotein-sorting protein [Aquisalimonadaceae bacterium]
MDLRRIPITSVVLLSLSATAFASDMDAGEIARRAADSARITAWRADIEITDLGRNGDVQRQRSGSISSRMRDNAIDAERRYAFSSPQDIRGTVLLVHENAADQDDIWFYLPALGNTRRIAGSAKRNSFVGTQYAFADLIGFQHERYQHQLTAAEQCAEGPCRVLDSVPSDEAYAEELGYSRVRTWVLDGSYYPVRIEYYDLGGELLKVQTMTDFAELEGAEPKALARTSLMVNKRSGRATSISMHEVNFAPAFRSGEFSPQRLESRR